MTESGRQFLVDALKKDFLPFVTAMGWRVEKRLPQFDGPELRRSAPLGYLRRPVREGVQAADIFFDKRRPRFQITIGSLPVNGLQSLADPGVIVPPNSLDADLADDSRILSVGLFGGTFFGFPIFKSPSEKEAKEVVRLLTELWVQVEEYFDSGRVGRNLTEGSGLKLAKHRSKLRRS